MDGDVKTGSPAATTATGSDMQALIPLAIGKGGAPSSGSQVVTHRHDKRPPGVPQGGPSYARTKRAKANATADLSYHDGAKWVLTKKGE